MAPKWPGFGPPSTAALALKEWQRALDLNAEVLQSEKRRGAGPLERARTRFNDYDPLLRLRRHAEARELLDGCRAVFERENHVESLGMVFSALASLEADLGHPDTAKRFEETALRYTYAAGNPEDVGISHFNLANHLTRTGADLPGVLGHRLAAALIRRATGSGRLEGATAGLADDLRRAGAQAAPALPADFAALCATVERVQGVRFRELVHGLVPGEDQLNAALRDVIARATPISQQS